MNNTLRAVAVVGLLAAAWAAWAYRYEPMGSQWGSVPLVWDRWEHRMCAVWPGGKFNCFDGQQQQ